MTTSLPTSKPPAEVHPMQALLDQGGYDMPQRGDIREGTILSVGPQEIVIDLGLKREGIVPANDVSRLDKETAAEIQEGTVWPVYILQTSDREGNLIVSLSRAIQEKDWLVAQQMMDNNEILEAQVAGHNNGGLEVIFGKLRGFVPASHISTLPRGASAEERAALLASYVGQTIPLKVVEVDRRRRRLIMSERAAHRRWQREHRKHFLDEIQVGEVRSGIVRSLATFGAFVDLGGVDGLIHVSELAWFPVTHPSEVLKVGDKVDVKVLRIDRQRERVGLSLKRVQPDPWSHVEADYRPTELVEAVVTRVTEFGAFVRLRSGVEGLLHVSEMADIRPDHPQSLVSPGDLLLLRVIRVESQRRRIGLSLRQVSETEWAEWAASYREKHAPPPAEEAPPTEKASEAIEAESAVAAEPLPEGEIAEAPVLVEEEVFSAYSDVPHEKAVGADEEVLSASGETLSEEIAIIEEEVPSASGEILSEEIAVIEEEVPGASGEVVPEKIVTDEEVVVSPTSAALLAADVALPEELGAPEGDAAVHEWDAANLVADVEYIEGIGPAYGQKLRQAGILTPGDLLRQGATAQGRRDLAEQTGIDGQLILRWANHADLYRISAVTDQYAELLEVAGVDTVVELATRNAANLHARLVSVNQEKNVAPDVPTLSDVENWVEQAKQLPRVITY
jgi:small subunit ribosomal protein S1